MQGFQALWAVGGGKGLPQCYGPHDFARQLSPDRKLTGFQQFSLIFWSFVSGPVANAGEMLF